MAVGMFAMMAGIFVVAVAVSAIILKEVSEE